METERVQDFGRGEDMDEGRIALAKVHKAKAEHVCASCCAATAGRHTVQSTS